MGKRTVLMVEPPEGSKYGFPIEVPQNWGFWEWEEKKRWFILKGYPKDLLESYGSDFTCSLEHFEVQDNYLEGRANLL
jgi:hypothetical protein